MATFRVHVFEVSNDPERTRTRSELTPGEGFTIEADGIDPALLRARHRLTEDFGLSIRSLSVGPEGIIAYVYPSTPAKG